MLEWIKKLDKRTKIMIVVIVALLIGIIVRWDHISSTVAEDFKSRFTDERGKPKESLQKPTADEPEEEDIVESENSPESLETVFPNEITDGEESVEESENI